MAPVALDELQARILVLTLVCQVYVILFSWEVGELDVLTLEVSVQSGHRTTKSAVVPSTGFGAHSLTSIVHGFHAF